MLGLPSPTGADPAVSPTGVPRVDAERNRWFSLRSTASSSMQPPRSAHLSRRPRVREGKSPDLSNL